MWLDAGMSCKTTWSPLHSPRAATTTRARRLDCCTRFKASSSSHSIPCFLSSRYASFVARCLSSRHVPFTMCLCTMVPQQPLAGAETRHVRDSSGKFIEGRDGPRRARLENSRLIISEALSTHTGLCSPQLAADVLSCSAGTAEEP